MSEHEAEPAAAGTRPPLEQVVREHGPRIYNLAKRMLGNDTDAEDVTQDVLLQLRKLDTFRGDAALPTWIHRVTVNASLNHRTKRARRQGRELTDPFDDFLEDGHHARAMGNWSSRPEASVLAAEDRKVIDAAIAEMPETYRDVYVLADLNEMANAEVGEALGLSVAAVKSRLHRARMWLRNELAPHFEEKLA